MSDWERDEDEAEEEEWDGDADLKDEHSSDTAPCPHCGQSVSEHAEVCPHCRNYISAEDAPSRKSPWKVILVVVLLVVILLVWVLSKPQL